MSAVQLLIQPVRFIIRNAIKLSMAGLPRGPHITRYFQYAHLQSILNKHCVSGKILSISHSTKLAEMARGADAAIVEANYPDCSILNLPFRDGEFDCVVSDQVLAHIEGDPQRAIDETIRVLKPGGVLVHTTCFVNTVDRCPVDYWRFSPEALKYLCRECLRVIDVGGWGNPYIWIIVWLGLRFEGIPHASWHPMHRVAILNDPQWPVHTWIIAKK